MRKFLISASIVATLLGAPMAQAHLQGDLIFRVGAIAVDPHEKSEHITLDGNSVGKNKAGLDSDVKIGFNYVYMLTDNIGVELLAATPFGHNVFARGKTLESLGLNGRLGTVQHLPPTISFVYFPLDDTYNFQPYAGVGANYTAFFKGHLSNSAESKGFEHGLEVDNSFGMAGVVGFDYMFGDDYDQYLFNAQIRYISIQTRATTRLKTGPNTSSRVDVNVDVDPWVYMVSVGYRF